MRFRIFTAAAGSYRDPQKYNFVAEFSDQQRAKEYVHYIFANHLFPRNDVIIRAIESDDVDPTEGTVDGIVTAIGEELSVSILDSL